MGLVKRRDGDGEDFEVVSTRRAGSEAQDTDIAIRQIKRLKGEGGDSLELAVKGAPDYQVSSTRKLKEGYYEVVLSKPKKKKKKTTNEAEPAPKSATVVPPEPQTATEDEQAPARPPLSVVPDAPEEPVGRAWRERAQRRAPLAVPEVVSLNEAPGVPLSPPSQRQSSAAEVAATHFDTASTEPSVAGRPPAVVGTNDGPLSLSATPDDEIVKAPISPVTDLGAHDEEPPSFKDRHGANRQDSARRVDSLFEEFEASVRSAVESDRAPIVAAPRKERSADHPARQKKKKLRRAPGKSEAPQDLSLDGSQQPQTKTALDRTLEEANPPVVTQLHEETTPEVVPTSMEPPALPQLKLVVDHEAGGTSLAPAAGGDGLDAWIEESEAATPEASDDEASLLDLGESAADLDVTDDTDAFDGFGEDDLSAAPPKESTTPANASEATAVPSRAPDPVEPAPETKRADERPVPKFASRDEMPVMNREDPVVIVPPVVEAESAKKKFASRDDMPERPGGSAPLPPPPVATPLAVAAGAMAQKPSTPPSTKADKKAKPEKRRPFSRAPKTEEPPKPRSERSDTKTPKPEKRRPFSRAPKAAKNEAPAAVQAHKQKATKEKVDKQASPKRRPFSRAPKVPADGAGTDLPPPPKTKQRPFSRAKVAEPSSVPPPVQGSVRPPPADLRPRVQIDPRTGRPVEAAGPDGQEAELVVIDDGSTSEVIVKDPGRRRRSAKEEESSTAEPRPTSDFLDHLVATGLVTEAQLDAAWDRSGKTDRTLFEGLVESKAIPEDQLVEAVSAYYELPACDLTKEEVEPDALDLVPEQIARAHMAFPITVSASGLLVAVAEPSERLAGLLAQASGHTIYMTIAKSTDIRWAIDTNYHALTGVAELVQEFEAEESPRRREQKTAANEQADENAPIVQVVNRILSQAMRDGASDVHIEPADDIVRVRNRVDGVLKVVLVLPAAMGLGLVSRIKIMAEMNIVERRRPQDGKFTARIDGRDIDVRVATVATIWGETCVMRILDKTRSVLGIADLGMAPDTHTNYSRLIRAPFGMVLCVGPTGSGKTTTLYASLTEISDVARNVMTIEDPVEYVFPSINQIQTNEQAGLTFATGLKSILRQDSDVVLVGEIRDVETARIAVQSTLTGHFVLSSLHATDAISALTRFIDMGIESFLIASSVIAIVGQRLVRQICQYCKEPYVPSDEEMAFYTKGGGPAKDVFYHGAGCNFCGHSGYKDRIGVYELFQITPEVKRLIVGFATEDELRDLAKKQGMRFLQDEAIAMVANDQTTSSEVVRSIYSL